MNGKRPRIVIVDSLDGLPADIEWVAVDFPNVTSREQAERMARRDDLCPHGLRLRGAFCLDCASASPDLADAFAFMASANPYARTRSEGPAGASYMVEVITDPNDRRGFDARPVRAV